MEPNRLSYQWLANKGSVDLSSVHYVWITAHNIAPTLELRGKDKRLMLSFIIKPFSLAGIACILQHIYGFSPDAESDAKCDDLLRGDTSSVTREVLSVQNFIRLAFTLGGAMFLTALSKKLFLPIPPAQTRSRGAQPVSFRGRVVTIAPINGRQPSWLSRPTSILLVDQLDLQVNRLEACPPSHA